MLWIQIMLLQHIFENLRIRLSHTHKMGIVGFLEEWRVVLYPVLFFYLLHTACIMNRIVIAQQEGSISFFKLQEEFMLALGHADKQRIPSLIDLRVRQLRLSGQSTYSVTKLGRRDKPLIKIVKKFDLAMMSKDFTRIFYT